MRNAPKPGPALHPRGVKGPRADRARNSANCRKNPVRPFQPCASFQSPEFRTRYQMNKVPHIPVCLSFSTGGALLSKRPRRKPASVT
jgi:hypothetical protein